MKLSLRMHVAVLAFAVALSALPGTGCRAAKYKLGLSTSVEEAEPGTPEATIQAALRAAMETDEEIGWRKYETLLHSNQRTSPLSLREWRELRFRRIRRQFQHYIDDFQIASFSIENEREFEDGTLEVYIENKMSDVPTPCAVKRDNDGAWRITRCSL